MALAQMQHEKDLKIAKQTYLMAAFTSLEQHFQVYLYRISEVLLLMKYHGRSAFFCKSGKVSILCENKLILSFSHSNLTQI
jgi:hypothetical protein